MKFRRIFTLTCTKVKKKISMRRGAELEILSFLLDLLEQLEGMCITCGAAREGVKRQRAKILSLPAKSSRHSLSRGLGGLLGPPTACALATGGMVTGSVLQIRRSDLVSPVEVF